MNRVLCGAAVCAAAAFLKIPVALAFPPACTTLKCDAARKEAKMYSDQAAQMRNNQKEYYDPKTAEMIKAYQIAADQCAVKAKDCSEGDSGGDGGDGGSGDPAREALTKALAQTKALGDLITKAGTKGISDAGKDMDKIHFESAGTKAKAGSLGRAAASTDLDSDEDDQSLFVSASKPPKKSALTALAAPDASSPAASMPKTSTSPPPPPIGWTSGECVEYCQNVQDAVVGIGQVHDAKIRALNTALTAGPVCTHLDVLPPFIKTLKGVSAKFDAITPPAASAFDLLQAKQFAAQFTSDLETLQSLLATPATWDGASWMDKEHVIPGAQGGEFANWWEVTIRTYTYQSTTCLGTCFALKSYEK